MQYRGEGHECHARVKDGVADDVDEALVTEWSNQAEQLAAENAQRADQCQREKDR